MVILKHHEYLFAINFKKSNNFTGKIILDRCFVFYKNGKYHRYYGPSWISREDFNKCWDFNGKEYGWANKVKTYNQKQFIKDLNKQWLL